MKKLLLAFVLLAVLVFVSYEKTVRDETKVKRQYQEGFDRGSREAAQAVSRADSLEQVAHQTKTTYTDSLQWLRLAQNALADSVAQALAGKDKEIAGLKERFKSVPRAGKTAHKSDSTGGGSRHAQILDYYRRKLGQLPGDLSEYERKVALGELREETARRFSISTGELDKIRAGARLSE